LERRADQRTALVYRRSYRTGDTAYPSPQAEAGRFRLRVTRDFPIAIVEAKASYKTAGEGLQQAKDYAEILDLKFAYATNGHEIIEFDFLTGEERFVGMFPSPDELWSRLRAGRSIADDKVAEQLLTPCFHKPDQKLRYYQDIAINRVVEAVLGGRRRILLTMATGTGKTLTAFQICWKLWNARWNRAGEYLRLPNTDKSVVYVGSHNWSGRALGPGRPRNVEASLRFELDYGDKVVKTPSIDRLARQGVLFNYAYRLKKPLVPRKPTRPSAHR
jgi:hypothetical protein